MMSNLSSRNYNEKRDFIRMKVDTEIIVNTEDTNQSVSAICRDLSGNGMLIETGEAIAEGITCKTTLPSQNDSFPSLNARIKILRCESMENEKYLLGTEIIEIES